MSTSFDDEFGFELDLEAAEEIRRQSNGKHELNGVLPKLAKRITTVDGPSAPANGSAVRPARRGTSKRASLQPVGPLPDEVERLRTQDIQPDLGSAADRALQAVGTAASASVESANVASGGPLPQRRVEGREIQQGHEQYALTYGMMLGIRVMTGHQSSFSGEERELEQKDYEADMELCFDPRGSSSPPLPTPPHKLSFSFKFKDYMPNVFRVVRALSGIDEADFMLSLAGDFNYIEFIANSKSGQFFFYSHDGRYMIKTQTQDESVLLRQRMPQYVDHLNNHPDSLLVRFYGMYRVKMKTLRSQIYFVVMSSVFNTDKSVDVKYDLKGSTVGRLTIAEDCAKGSVQKDLNLAQSGRTLRLGPANAKLFRDTLAADVAFLCSLKIMDYSLLVGIHSAVAGKASPARRRSSVVLSQRAVTAASNASTSSASTAAVSVFQACHGGIASVPEAQEIYFLGIIDILQLYNTGKKLETFVKGFSHDKTQLSSVPPPLYADRMLSFVMQFTDFGADGDHAGAHSNGSHATGQANGNSRRPSLDDRLRDAAREKEKEKSKENDKEKDKEKAKEKEKEKERIEKERKEKMRYDQL